MPTPAIRGCASGSVFLTFSASSWFSLPTGSATHKTVHNKIERKTHTDTAPHTVGVDVCVAYPILAERHGETEKRRQSHTCNAGKWLYCRYVTWIIVKRGVGGSGGTVKGEGAGVGGGGRLKLVRINKRLLAHGVQWQRNFYAQREDPISLPLKIHRKK